MSEPVVRYYPEARGWRATREGVYGCGQSPEKAVECLIRTEQRLKQMIQDAMHRDDTTEATP